MRVKTINLAAIAIALVVTAGCINYDQELTLNADGSGTVKIRYDRVYGVAGEVEEGSGADTSAAPKLSFTEEEIKAEYEGSPLTVRNIVIGKTGEGDPEATYYIDFQKVTDLNGYGIFAPEGNKLKQKFSLDADGDTQVFKQLFQINTDINELSRLRAYKLTCRLNVPGKIVDTNGTVTGDTVKWEYSRDKLINTDTVMTATYESTARTAGRNVAGIIAVILCVIIIIVIILVIILLLTKKKKKPAEPEPTPPSEPDQPAV